MRLPYRKPGKYTNLPKDPLMTQDKYEELAKELAVLKEKKQPFAAKEVARLGEFGDFSENAEYQIAKGRLRGINNRITELEYILKIATIIAPQSQTNYVSLGHTVTLEQQDGTTQMYTILGSSETNPSKGVISSSSPLGSAILGKKKGDQVTISLPKGQTVYTIRSIS